jgi:hypothetical protein
MSNQSDTRILSERIFHVLARIEKQLQETDLKVTYLERNMQALFNNLCEGEHPQQHYLGQSQRTGTWWADDKNE